MAKVLERKVTLVNAGKIDFDGRWDSVDYLIRSGESLEIDQGIAKHFCDPERYPGNELVIEEIIPDPITSREPGNPLEDGSRGKGFSKITSQPKEAAK